jgi:CO dehydrogenase/acetyl-CoA synthase gamma subunit (corrinoid Fe-S protein)
MPAQQKNFIDILRLLEQSNCKDCGSPTCMAFAALVLQETALACRLRT